MDLHEKIYDALGPEYLNLEDQLKLALQSLTQEASYQRSVIWGCFAGLRMRIAHNITDVLEIFWFLYYL